MVVVSDKILRIVSPFGKPATTAALNKLSLQEKTLERQILELKSSAGAGAADIQPEIQKLEEALRAVREKMKPLKAQLEELKEQEDKEAEAGAEPPRLCRRPQLLRGWGYDEQDDEQVLA